jgi:hypothetical protein
MSGVIITSAEQNMKLMSDDTVTVKVESPVKLWHAIGDSITVIGRKYKLNQLPKEDKDGEKYSYDLTFEGVHYDLLAASFNLNIDTTTNELQDLLGDSLTGNLSRFLTVIIANANRVFPGKWVAGNVVTSTDKTLTFSEEDNCLSVINMLCDEFDCEYYISQNAGVNTLHFQAITGTVSGTFEFGYLKGYYQMNRDNVNAENLCTRLFAYGTTENVPNRYRADRLCLPGKNKNDSFIQSQNKIDQYGLYEKKKYFDITPGRTGKITGLGADINSFVDSSMYDLNDKWPASPADYEEYLAITNQVDSTEVMAFYIAHVVGTYKYRITETPLIRFTTGNLSGYEVQVQSYDHATHTFKIVPTKEQDLDIPSAEYPAYQFGVGDTYKLSNVNLQLIQIQAAETELQAKAVEYFVDFSTPFVQYRINLDEFTTLFKNASAESLNMFLPGYKIYIKDNDFQIDRLIRIQEVKRDLLYPLTYEIVTADVTTRDKKYQRVRTIDIQSQINNQFFLQTSKTSNLARKMSNLVPVIERETILINEDPIIKDGVMAVAINNLGVNVKFGDGSSKYSELKFDTKSNSVDVETDASEPIFYNPINSTTYIFNRNDATSSTFYFDSQIDNVLGLKQLDGRIHRIVVANKGAKEVSITATLTQIEIDEGSIIKDFGTVMVNEGSYALIEFFWYELSGIRTCVTKLTII